MVQAMDIIMRRNATVCDIMSSMMMSIFGFPIAMDTERASDQRAKSVARLVTELGAQTSAWSTASPKDSSAISGRRAACTTARYCPVLRAI
jgi:hypothetical protein